MHTSSDVYRIHISYGVPTLTCFVRAVNSCVGLFLCWCGIVRTGTWCIPTSPWRTLSSRIWALTVATWLGSPMPRWRPEPTSTTSLSMVSDCVVSKGCLLSWSCESKFVRVAFGGMSEVRSPGVKQRLRRFECRNEAFNYSYFCQYQKTKQFQ